MLIKLGKGKRAVKAERGLSEKFEERDVTASWESDSVKETQPRK